MSSWQPRSLARLSLGLISLALCLVLSASPAQGQIPQEEEAQAKPSFRQRLKLHRPQSLEIVRDSTYNVPGLEADQSGCSCYRVKNSFCCWQALCVCHNVCYNGSAILGNFKRIPCVHAEPPAAPLKGQKASLLRPIKCRRTDRFKQHLSIALREAPIPHGLAFRYPKWRQTRRAIDWREGTTFLAPLHESCINIAHFWGKVGSLLLVNNATSAAPGLPYHVDRFMFPRHPNVLQRMWESGAGGWQSNMLRQLVAMAARDRLQGARLKDTPGLKPRRFAEKNPLLDGAVEFERAFDSASERQPMCFDRVVIPGILKAVTYPSGAGEALQFREAVREDLGLDLPREPQGMSPHSRAKKPVRVLYIVRNATTLGKPKRTLTPESEVALMALLQSMNFKVTAVDFTHMAFKDQFRHMLGAEMILGLHGAALINSALAGNRSILFEIMPYRVFHQGYYFASVNAGLTYFLHQCRQGTPQSRDLEFETLSVRGCMNYPPCKEWFVQQRQIELTREDLLDLGALLMQARQVIGDMRWNVKWAGNKLKKRFPELCAYKQRDTRCRMDLIRSPVADPNVECILKKDCDSRLSKEEEESMEEIM